MEWISQPDAWIGLLTLTLLEIVLGIDNIVFISIITGKLPPAERPRAQKLGLGLAVVTRILFLLSIGAIMRLEKPFFEVAGKGFSGKDLILLIGGLFLIAKATSEIHSKLEGVEHHHDVNIDPKKASLGLIIGQILLIDLVFSIDSVVTAVGMVDHIEIMIAAVIISIAIMLAFVGKISEFVEAHPTVKMLALAFLILIGFNLAAEGLHFHIPKGYTYSAMAFSLVVEFLNIRLKKKTEPVSLRHNYPVPPQTEEDVKDESSK